MTILYAILAALLLLAALPLLAEALRTPMTKKRQSAAPGEIADLSQGTTHYRWHGPEKGQVVLCIHGLSTPSYVFAATERSLAGLGYRVLSFDLYGRGHSARAPGDQTVDFFLTQTTDLLADQGVTGDVIVLGFSMGAQIATAYAAQNADQIKALILVAPAGISSKTAGDRSKLWQAPVAGDWLMRVAGGWALRRELVEHRNIATIIPDFEDRQAKETRMRGFLPAVLSSRRHLLSTSLLPDLKLCENQDIPVFALWGTDDPIVPLSAMGQMTRHAADTQHGQISGAGHNLLQTHPAHVADHLAAFLKT